MFPDNKIHLIGIGGIGISAIAYFLLAEKKRVTGSDQSDSELIQDLRSAGAEIAIGHEEKNLPDDAELVIYSEAIDREKNPEFLKAKRLNIRAMTYFQALGQLSRAKKTLVVTGSHGKTTTTAMLGLILTAGGLDPTVIVGSKVREFNGRNIRIGKGEWLVAEGCEYRRSFLNLQPFGMIMLNGEADHLDYYKDENDYKSAFEELIRTIPAEGFLAANGEDPVAREVSRACPGKVILIQKSDADQLDINLKVWGDFNRMNAAHAAKAATAIGIENEAIKKALEAFGGTWRRMENKGFFRGAPVIDDYGHHPTEVRSTLEAIKSHFPGKRLICVFQPHQYSRTYQLLDQFFSAFGSAGLLIIPEIYAARDSAEDRSRISAESFVKKLSEKHPAVQYGGSLEQTFEKLKDLVTENDVVVTMGAGDITKISDWLVSL